MTKLTPISGFPEWLPQERIAEEAIISKIKAIYASFGFVPIETPAVELLSTLGAKGVIDKELYGLKRVQATDDKEAELALHFDLTVPFARYVAQHYNELTFPFKRYQVQKVWRGDRPQKGRAREFYQFDIDMIARDELPLSCDAEIMTALDRAFLVFKFPAHVIKINNRKLLLGFYNSVGLSEVQQKAAVRVVDKIDKIGPAKVAAELQGEVGLTPEQAQKIVALTEVKVSAIEAQAKIDAIGCTDPIFLQGREEILRVLELAPESTRSRVRVDLSLARGLDYYTGAIFEIVIPEFPSFGSLGGGGRYDDLASEYINKKLPGVGASLGLTRLMELGLSNNLIDLTKRSLSDILVTVYEESQRVQCNTIAEEARALGIGAEVYYKAVKLGKQIEYAEAKGMEYVVFLNGAEIQVKNLKTKEQVTVPSFKEWLEKRSV